MKLSWLTEKPFRWACHQVFGQAKGEVIFLAFKGRFGEWLEVLAKKYTPKELEDFLNSLPEKNK